MFSLRNGFETTRCENIICIIAVICLFLFGFFLFFIYRGFFNIIVYYVWLRSLEEKKTGGKNAISFATSIGTNNIVWPLFVGGDVEIRKIIIKNGVSDTSPT